MKQTYRGFTVGQEVTVKQITECQYYNYPVGRNLHTLVPDVVCKIISIPPKVRVSDKGTGEYFFILHKLGDDSGTIYPVLDYHNLKVVRNGYY